MTIEEHSLEIALNTGAPAGIAMFPMLMMMMMVMMMMVLPQWYGKFSTDSRNEIREPVLPQEGHTAHHARLSNPCCFGAALGLRKSVGTSHTPLCSTDIFWQLLSPRHRGSDFFVYGMAAHQRIQTEKLGWAPTIGPGHEVSNPKSLISNCICESRPEDWIHSECPPRNSTSVS